MVLCGLGVATVRYFITKKTANPENAFIQKSTYKNCITGGI
jgi:hypothetical protein